MERNVFQLESGNYDFDDSEIKQRYDNQRQLNIQLQEQKRWLEHELEEVSLVYDVGQGAITFRSLGLGFKPPGCWAFFCYFLVPFYN